MIGTFSGRSALTKPRRSCTHRTKQGTGMTNRTTNETPTAIPRTATRRNGARRHLRTSRGKKCGSKWTLMTNCLPRNAEGRRKREARGDRHLATHPVQMEDLTLSPRWAETHGSINPCPRSQAASPELGGRSSFLQGSMRARTRRSSSHRLRSSNRTSSRRAGSPWLPRLSAYSPRCSATAQRRCT